MGDRQIDGDRWWCDWYDDRYNIVVNTRFDIWWYDWMVDMMDMIEWW
jgi:hypothetical protein